MERETTLWQVFKKRTKTLKWANMAKDFKDHLKKTEGLVFVAEEQAFRTNGIRKNINRRKILRKCNLCGKREEPISYLIAEFKKLAQREYKKGIIVLQELHIQSYFKILG